MPNYFWKQEQLDMFFKTLYELKEHPTVEELSQKVNMPEEAVEALVGGSLDFRHIEIKDNRIYVTPEDEIFYKAMKEQQRLSNYRRNPDTSYIV